MHYDIRVVSGGGGGGATSYLRRIIPAIVRNIYTASAPLCVYMILHCVVNQYIIYISIFSFGFKTG